MSHDPRAINPHTGDPMTDVVITRPGRDTLRYGPIPFRHQAERWITYLNWSRQSTAMPTGTTWEMSPHDPSQEHINPDTIPTSIGEITFALLDPSDDASGEDAFPDLYLLLKCMVGDIEAAERWKEACAYTTFLEQHNEDDDA